MRAQSQSDDVEYTDSGVPIIKVPLTRRERIDLVLVFGLVIANWIYCGVSIGQLPGVIVTHWDSNGVPDGVGSSSVIFLFPGIASGLTLLLTLLAGYPHKFKWNNVTVTKENARLLFPAARLLLRVINIGLAITLLLIPIGVVRSTLDDDYGEMSNMVIPIIVIPIATILLGVIGFAVRVKRISQSY